MISKEMKAYIKYFNKLVNYVNTTQPITNFKYILIKTIK